MRRKLKTTLETTTNNAQQSQQPRTNSSDAVEKRVTLMVAVMIAAFLAAWTPYSIMALIETFIGDAENYAANESNIAENAGTFYSGTISPAIATVPSLFAKTSAVLNPLIYGLLNTQASAKRLIIPIDGERKLYVFTFYLY
jgi:c-opsin